MNRYVSEEKDAILNETNTGNNAIHDKSHWWYNYRSGANRAQPRFQWPNHV